MTARNGSAVWQGDIESGSGAITVGDGFFEGIEGEVPAVDAEQCDAIAEEARATRPVARALAGIPEIVLAAKLVAGAKGQ